MPENRSEFILNAKWAARLCAALLIGIALVVAFGFYDRARLASLETVEEPTALGDSAFFKPPEKVEPGTVLVKFAGQPRYPTGAARTVVDDSSMIRVGFDDSKALSIYKLNGRGVKKDGYLYLKVASGQYIETGREPLPK